MNQKNVVSNFIIFFDGICGLCNYFVDFVLRMDRDHIFSFAPLQGKTAQQFLPSQNLEKSMCSIVLFMNGRLYEKSDACLYIFHALGGFWKFLNLFKIVPRFLRDIAYDFVARYRYQWFGKRNICRIPTPQEKKFFLD